MPAYSNPLTPARLNNPMKPGSNPFLPHQNGPQQYDGLNTPQIAPPLNSGVTAPQGASAQSNLQLPGLWNDVLDLQPSPTLPYVPPPTTGIIEGMLGSHNAYASAALPLLDQLLGVLQGRTDITSQYFGPEMALRQGLLDQISRQDNSFLEALLQQQQRVRPQGSGAFFFEGFTGG